MTKPTYLDFVDGTVDTDEPTTGRTRLYSKGGVWYRYPNGGSPAAIEGVSTARQIIAGAGLGGTGTLASDVTLSVNVDDSSIEINADTLRVKAGGITNAMIVAAAGIPYSKLTLTGAILNADLAGSIAYSKLSLAGAILNADLAGSIAYSKLSLAGSILNSDINASAGINLAKLESITALRLVGKDTGAGVPGLITVGGGLEFTGSGGIQRSATTTDVVIPAGSNVATIQPGVVTYAKMQNVAANNRFLGRISGAGGSTEELTPTQAQTIASRSIATRSIVATQAITAANTEQLLQAWTIPAAQLAAGDVIHLHVDGYASSTTTTTTSLVVRVRIVGGGGTVGSGSPSPAVAGWTVPSVVRTTLGWSIDAHVAFRTVGAAAQIIGGINLGGPFTVGFTTMVQAAVTTTTTIDTTAAVQVCISWLTPSATIITGGNVVNNVIEVPVLA